MSNIGATRDHRGVSITGDGQDEHQPGTRHRLVARAPITDAPRSDALFTAAVVAVFMVVGLVGILHHEMWRDELQVWLIAKDSSSVSNLFRNLRYEKHPGLWHLCLYVITRFTSNPLAMQLVHLAIATAATILFVKFSPFTKLQKVLFPFGYFPLFEYAIISRSYALGLLLVFSFCVLFAKRDKNYLALSGVLFLLANTSLYGLIVAAALSLALLLHAVTNGDFVRVSGKRLSLACGALLVALGVAASLAQIIPPSKGAVPDERGVVVNAFSERLAMTRENKGRAVHALKTVWDSYLPMPNFSTYKFWNTNVLSLFPGKVERRVGLILSLALLALATLLFASRPAIFFAFLTGTAGLLLFTYLIYYGGIRHHGHLFMVVIACLWISAYEPRSDWLGSIVEKASDLLHKYKNATVTGFLCLHLLAGVFAVSMDFLKPFSASKAAAGFIKNRQPSNMLIVGRPDLIASPLSAYLDRKIYYFENDRLGSFVVWNDERKYTELEEALDKLSKVVEEENGTVLFVSDDPLRDSPASLNITELEAFTEAIVGDEIYYLYLVR